MNGIAPICILILFVTQNLFYILNLFLPLLLPSHPQALEAIGNVAAQKFNEVNRKIIGLIFPRNFLMGFYIKQFWKLGFMAKNETSQTTYFGGVTTGAMGIDTIYNM